MLINAPDRLFRIVSAVVVAGAVTLGIFYVLALLIGGEWIIVPESQQESSREQVVEADGDALTISLDSTDSCDESIDTFMTLIADSRACNTDFDCKLASFG